MKFRSARVLLPALLVAFAGCAVQSAGNDSTGDAVTNIPQTDVADQGQTGNCWLYTTAAWVESLRAAKDGDVTTHYSPAYLMYWDLFQQITTDKVTQAHFGGYWPRAVDLVSQYGLVKMGSFVKDDVAAGLAALTAVNAALSKGSLSTDAARKDPAAVRAALDKAFGLSSDVIKALDDTFGKDAARTFDAGAKSYSDRIVVPSELNVRTATASGDVDTTLDQVLGTRGKPVWDDFPRYWVREGALAWNAISPDWGGTTTTAPGQYGQIPHAAHAPISSDDDDAGTGDTDAGDTDAGDTDAGTDDSDAGDPPSIDAGPPSQDDAHALALVRRLQKALNAGAPLPFAWYVNFDAVDKKGHFRHQTASAYASQTGAHETLMTDYEVTNVPGYGTLAAGEPADDAQKTAALKGTVTFFRTKNSWGKAPGGWAEPLAGYNDLDVAYLTQPLTICPDPKGNGDGGSAAPQPCQTITPLIIDVGLPPGF